MFNLPKETEIIGDNILKAEDITNAFSFHHRRTENIKKKISDLKIANQIENKYNANEIIGFIEVLMPDIFKCNTEYLSIYYMPAIINMISDIYEKLNRKLFVVLKSTEKIANVIVYKAKSNKILYKLVDNNLNLHIPVDYKNIDELYNIIIQQIEKYSDTNCKVSNKYTWLERYKLVKGYDLKEVNDRCEEINEEIDEIIEKAGDIYNLSNDDIEKMKDIRIRINNLYSDEEINEKAKENYDEIFSYIEEIMDVQITD